MPLVMVSPCTWTCRRGASSRARNSAPVRAATTPDVTWPTRPRASPALPLISASRAARSAAQELTRASRVAGILKEAATMSFMNKMRNMVRTGKGSAKQQVGRATDDPRLEAEGDVDRIDGQLRQAGEHVKNAAHDAFRK